jgi:hypothetical protein
MAETIDFHGWVRPASGALVTGVEQGRARAAVNVTLTATSAAGATTGTDSASLAFLLAGPPDVAGLQPGVVTRRYPSPGTIDAETTKCPYLELSDPGLPWRYTPAANPPAGNRRLRPWLVLLSGSEEELPITGDKVAVAVAVQKDHKLADSHRWAHVQERDGRRTARLLSPRPLPPDKSCVAVLVPAFAPVTTGSPVDAWTGAASVVLPVYASWRFRSGPGGDFLTLAKRLKPGQADPATGRAPVTYSRLPAAGPIQARGALAPVGATDAPLPPAVAADLAGLTSPAPDPRGRTVIGLPLYGSAWRDDPRATPWGATLNSDPRHRGAAGLGLRIGIQEQDSLTDEALKRAGALGVAAQRIRHLSLGIAAASSLWQRRLPVGQTRRVWVLGPMLRRTVTTAGTLADLATADGRPLPRGIFSGAARRILRSGPARTARARPGANDPAVVLATANTCPPPEPPAEVGVPLTDMGAGDFEKRLAAARQQGTGDAKRLLAVLADLQQSDPVHAKQLGQLLTDLQARMTAGTPLPWSTVAALIAALQAPEPRDEVRIRELFDLLAQGAGTPVDDLADLDALAAQTVQPAGPPEPCKEVNLSVLFELGMGANPGSTSFPGRRRVLDKIEGLDPPNTTPPETCPGMDLPAWRSLNKLAPEWLLPGVGALADDAVIAMQTNPQFVDAFMVGLNTQLLSELRWRNVRVAAGCTPMKVFWDRADTNNFERVDDIRGVRTWPSTSTLGDPKHQPAGVGGTDLVLVIRGQLLLRYPSTVLSLVSAVHGTKVDFTIDPDPAKPPRLPTFQGRIGTDVLLFGFANLPAGDIGKFWLSLEEPSHGYRFVNNNPAANAAADGAQFADLAFADPVRVLIRGTSLAPGGAP